MAANEGDAGKPRGYAELSVEMRRYAHILAVEIMAGAASSDPYGQNAQHAVAALLRVAFFDAVRDEWYDIVKKAGLEKSLELARALMQEDGYRSDDPICGLPGKEPYIATVDGKKHTCYEHSMAQCVPLSAIYTDKVRQALEISERLSKMDANDTQPATTADGNRRVDPAAPDAAAPGDA